MKILLFVFGTRPEAIKMAPLILAARQTSDFKAVVCVTAQHRAMLDSVLQFFDIEPDFDLDLMKPGQTLTSITTGVLTGLVDVLGSVQPDWVLVQGDTTTAFAAALAAFYAKVPVAHVEAGLRTGNIYQPWPEEMNRKLIGASAKVHFPPTEPALANLKREGISLHNCVVTGNTGIDALYLVRERLIHDVAAKHQVQEMLSAQKLENFLGAERRYVLVTAHRRESFGAGFSEICQAIVDLACAHPDVDFIFPVHPNPAVRSSVDQFLRPNQLANVTLCEPLDYLPFVALMINASVVLTDSGGVQEEAPSLGKPVVVMRDVTERMEGAGSGLVDLAGPHRERIVSAVTGLLNSAERSANGAGNYYGDGQAAGRILEKLRNSGDIL